MLYRTQEWLPWINNLCKNVLDNIATLDMKAHLCVKFFYTFTLAQHFIQSEYTGGWSLHLEIASPERDIIFMQVATFIMQNWCLHTIWRMDMGKDEFHSYTHEGFFAIRCSDRFWGGIWSDMTTEQVSTCTKMDSGGLKWGCRITENTLANWVCASLYTTVYLNWGAHWPPGWVFWAVLWGMSPQRLETSPTGRSVAVHVEHRSSSTALCALSWRSRFTVFWHYWWLLSELPQCRGSRPTASTAGGGKKLCCFQKWSGRKCDDFRSYGQQHCRAWARGKSEHPADQNDVLLVRLDWSVIYPDIWVVLFYFSIKSHQALCS